MVHGKAIKGAYLVIDLCHTMNSSFSKHVLYDGEHSSQSTEDLRECLSSQQKQMNESRQLVR